MSEDFPAPLAAFRPGTMLAGYQLEARIGAGGMAVAFLARDVRLDARPSGAVTLKPQFVIFAGDRRPSHQPLPLAL